MRQCFWPYAPKKFALIAFALSLTSCVELSSPISVPEEAKIDKNLLGAWKCVDDKPISKQFAFVIIGKSNPDLVPSGLMKITTVENDYREQIVVNESRYAYSTTIADKHYATFLDAAQYEKDKANVKTLMLIKYTVDADRLVVWGMDSKPVEAAVRAKQIKGRIEWKGLLGWTHVTLESGEDLARFLSGGGDKSLFSEANKLVLTRVK